MGCSIDHQEGVGAGGGCAQSAEGFGFNTQIWLNVNSMVSSTVRVHSSSCRVQDSKSRIVAALEWD